jgi:hypothetical protein
MITKDSSNIWCDVLVFLGCYDLLLQVCKMITKDSSNCQVMFWFIWILWDATIFCNNFARWLQKIVATCDVLFFWDAMIFCNNFARWLQKIIAWYSMPCAVPCLLMPSAVLCLLIRGTCNYEMRDVDFESSLISTLTHYKIDHFVVACSLAFESSFDTILL